MTQSAHNIPDEIWTRLFILREGSQKTEENERRTSSLQRVTLTMEETLDYSKRQADRHGEKQQAERDLASVKKQMQARIEGLQAEMDQLNEALRNGYELRDVPCVEILDYPKRGRKTTFRLDTREVVGDAPMTTDDSQRQLRFEESKKAKPEEQAPAPESAKTPEEPKKSAFKQPKDGPQ